MKKPTKVVVVGSGYWGINYVRLLSNFPDADLVCVCEQSDKRINETRNRFPNIYVEKSLDNLLNNVEFDAAVICTDPSSHYEISRKFIEAGKHILVEKPLTTSGIQADDLIKLARENKVTLMVGHIFLFNTGIEKVKQDIDAGYPGKIHYMYSTRTNLGPIRSDVNAIWDLAPHDIAIFNYFLDSYPEWVSAVGTSFLRSQSQDVGFIVLGYPNGILGNIHVSWADPNKVREVVVVGSEQRIVFNDISAQQKVTIYKKGIAASTLPFLSYGDYQFSLRDGDIISPSLIIGEPLKKQLIHFLDCANTGKKPITDGESGMYVVKVLEAIDASMRMNGAPIKIQ